MPQGVPATNNEGAISHLSRPPDARLKPFVQTLWSWETKNAVAYRERVMPTGCFHIVLRLAGPGLCLYRDALDPLGRTHGLSLIGGVREAAYVRQVEPQTISVGAQLHPGAASLLLGIPADELSEQHTELEAVWPQRFVATLRDQLLCARGHADRLGVFEAALLDRVPDLCKADALVQHAVQRLRMRHAIGRVAEEVGLSHRHFISRFTRAVGLTPKRFAQVLRFQQAASALAQDKSVSLSRVALGAGYSDQAHLCREFAFHSGLSPGHYAQLPLASPNHVPVEGQISSRRGGRVRGNFQHEDS